MWKDGGSQIKKIIAIPQILAARRLSILAPEDGRAPEAKFDNYPVAFASMCSSSTSTP